jgi:hypothetical protein
MGFDSILGRESGERKFVVASVVILHTEVVYD